MRAIKNLKKKKKHLSDREKHILTALDKVGGIRTVNAISKLTGMSYVTTKKYLKT